MTVAAFAPLIGDILGGAGGPGGLLSALLGGGKNEVNQTVSQSTSATLLAAINNTIGPGSASSGAQTVPVTQNPSAINTAGSSPSPAPVYGQTFGPDYTSGDLAADADAAPALAGFSPAMLAVAGLGVAALLFLNKGK